LLLVEAPELLGEHPQLIGEVEDSAVEVLDRRLGQPDAGLDPGQR
jgi:hypothetical protein